MCIEKNVNVSIVPEQVIQVKLINQLCDLNLSNVDYNSLKNIPTLNGVKIIGDKLLDDYGIENIEILNNIDIEELLNNFI